MLVQRSWALWLGAGLVLGWCSSSWIRWARQQLLQLLWPMGPLQLQRPLVAFDIESTGLNVSKDRILEIAAVKLLPNGRVEVKGPQRLNPGMAIPAEVTAIHHITKEDIQDCPAFADVAQEWRDFLEGADLLGYNAKKFDVPILRNEFRRAGHFNFPQLGVPVVDAFRIFCSQEPRTLSAAVQLYTGQSHSKEQAHSALGDAWATLRVLVGQVRRYPDLPRSVSALAELCAKPGRAQDITPDSKFQWRGDQPVMGFGKYQGEPLAVLIARHKDHLMWMSGQDWGDESLIVVGKALQGLLPTKAGGWQPLFDTPAPEGFYRGTAANGSSMLGGARANGSSSSSSSRQQPHHQQPQEQEQRQQQQDVPAQSQQQVVPAAGAISSNVGSSNGSGGSSHEQQAASWAVPAAAGAAAAAASTRSPAVTGWPDLGTAGHSNAVPYADSWGCEPSAVPAEGAAATEAAADGSWDGGAGAAAGGDAVAAGADAGGVDDDGWSALQEAGYLPDPEPQEPAEEEWEEPSPLEADTAEGGAADDGDAAAAEGVAHGCDATQQ